MAWISRVYNWVTDRNNGVPITASRMDAEFDNIIAGLNDCMVNTGAVPAAANLSMGGFKITNLGTPTLPADAATKAYAELVSLYGLRTIVHAYLNALGPQSYTASSAAKVTMDGERVDLLNEWNTLLRKFTASSAGYYRITIVLDIIAASGGDAQILIYKNAAPANLGTSYMHLQTTAADQTMTVDLILSLAANDVIEPYFSNTQNAILGADDSYILITRIA